MNFESAPGETRTHGKSLRRRLLYPLSYGRMTAHILYQYTLLPVKQLFGLHFACGKTIQEANEWCMVRPPA